MKDSPQQKTTSYGSRGNTGRYSLESPPPADHISLNQEQVGTRYGLVEIVSPERRYTKGWSRCMVLTRCTSCEKVVWTHLANLAQGKSKGCQHCSQPRQIPKWLERRLTAAKQRCTNPNDPGFKSYGAKGVMFMFASVTAAGLWLIENLGLPPRAVEIDRTDSCGHYAPGNLRWASKRLNRSNKRGTVLGDWNPQEWPYARTVVTRKLSAGLSRAEILSEAREAVLLKRKNWRGIEAKLASLTS